MSIAVPEGHHGNPAKRPDPAGQSSADQGTAAASHSSEMTALPSGTDAGIDLLTRAQRRLIFSQASILVVCGGIGSGKSLPATFRVVADATKYNRYGCEQAILMEEGATIPSTIGKALRDHALPRELRGWNAKHGFGWKENEPGTVGVVFWPRDKVTGERSIIYMLGVKEHGRLDGKNLWSATIDQGEKFSKEQLQAVEDRCWRGRRVPAPGHLHILLNASHRRHHLNTRFKFDLGSRRFIEGEGDAARNVEVAWCPPEDALTLATPEYKATLLSKVGVDRVRLFLNKFADGEGSYFTMWRPYKSGESAHVIDPPSTAITDEERSYPPAHWPRYRGFDWGWRNPAVCLTWARDPEGCYHLYRQRVMTETLPEDFARFIADDEERELRALRTDCDEVRAWELRPYLNGFRYGGRTTLLVDDSRSDPEDPGDSATLDRYGIWNQPGHGDNTYGPRLMAQMLSQGLIRVWVNSLVEEDARLVDRHEATCFQEEIPAQRHRPEPKTANPVNEKLELLVDEQNHCVKAALYLFLALDSGEGPRVGVY